MLAVLREKFRLEHVVSVVALVALVALVIASLVSIGISVSSNSDQLERKRNLLARMQQVVDARTAEAENRAGADASTPFFLADNSSAAAAQLQDHLVRQLQTLGIVPSVVEVQPQDLDPGLPDTLGRVQASAEFEFSERDTGSILKMAEGSSPELRIDSLEIRDAERKSAASQDDQSNDGWRQLKASIAVSGYWVSGDAK